MYIMVLNKEVNGWVLVGAKKLHVNKTRRLQ